MLFPQKDFDETRQLILAGLERETELWPRWANQNCYFAFNLADWAILSQDADIVDAVAKNIESFQSQQDWYNRDSAMDAILNLRQIWNWIVLDRREDAAMLAQQLDWANIHTMETRTLSLWFHAAMWVLGLADKDASLANIRHHASLTKYHGFERRILHLVQRLVLRTDPSFQHENGPSSKDRPPSNELLVQEPPLRGYEQIFRKLGHMCHSKVHFDSF